MSEIVERIRETFEPSRDPARAAPMAAYMKDHFPFLGLAAPLRRELQRQPFKETPKPTSPTELLDTVAEFWAQPEREYQYVGTEWLSRHSKLLGVEHLDDVSLFITTKAWWDTVDHLCRHPVSDIVRRSWDVGRAVMDRWLVDPNMWMQRSAILHMESWRGEMDQAWLFAACLRHASQKEFFIRKAIGWALRSYAHQGPNEADAVRTFLATHASELSGLSTTEALKRVRH